MALNVSLAKVAPYKTIANISWTIFVRPSIEHESFPIDDFLALKAVGGGANL